MVLVALATNMRKIIISLIGLATLIGAVLYEPTSSIAVSAQLKAPVNDILISRNLERKKGGRTEKFVQYAYKTTRADVLPPRQGVTKQAEKNHLVVTEENMGKRTSYSRTFETDKKGVQIHDFIPDLGQYYKDPLGNWWQIEYATTTPELFSKVEGSRSLLSRLIVKTVHAQTFFPDGTTVDGYTRQDQSTQSWSTIHDAAGNDAGYTDATVNVVGIELSSNSSKFNQIFRAPFLFPTAALSGLTVISGEFSIVGTSKSDAGSISPSINVYSSNPASDTTLTGTDYSTFGTTAFSTTISYASYSTSGRNTFPLNASGIAAVNTAGGITKLGAREADYDAPNIEPTNAGGTNRASMLFAAFSETADTTNDPQLVIVTAGAGGGATLETFLLFGDF